MVERRFLVSLRARALLPFFPSFRQRFTAAGFFPPSPDGSGSGASPSLAWIARQAIVLVSGGSLSASRSRGTERVARHEDEPLVAS